MRHFAIASAAVAILLCLVVTTLKLNAAPAASGCPRCGKQLHVSYGAKEDLLTCPCGYGVRQPPSGKVSIPLVVESLIDVAYPSTGCEGKTRR